MADERPNPDELLARVKAEEQKQSRGRLKIFFGMSAGVGKTYAMLEEARKRAEEGTDVLVGYAEPHIRPETEALLLGLEILPYKIIEYKGVQFKEFDLEAALARKPALICVDELAHTNAPGMRHAKRYQDVMELLDAGINVYTTLNVQHLESVNDIVERTSGIKVQETLPDKIFEQADDVQLIDIPPEKLMERVREGRIYQQHDADHLNRHFFNQGNLSALRELALRRTADRVDAQMEDFRRDHAVKSTWPTADRIMVCVGPSPSSAQLVRAARRMGTALKAQWIAVYVETPAAVRYTTDDRDRIFQTLRLAEHLGGQTVTLSGAQPVEEILSYARARNVARIIIGKPSHSRWRERVLGSMVDDLIRKSGGIDVYVIREEKDAGLEKTQRRPMQSPKIENYAWALGVTAITTFVGYILHQQLGLADSNALMIDLIGVTLVAWRLGRGPAILASILSVVAFDYVLVRPHFAFAVSDTQYFITFLVLLATALLISTLTDRLYRQGEMARRRGRRTVALLELAKDLAATPEKQRIIDIAVKHVSQVFDCQVVVLLSNEDRKLASAGRSADAPKLDEKELGVAQWVFDRGQPAGATTDTLPFAQGLYLPLRASRGITGVLGVFAPRSADFSDPERLHLLEAFVNQTALALERAMLADEAQRAWERAEAEFIRNTLLSSVSHDLRTPLAAITGSATTLLESGEVVAPATRVELLHNIISEAEHMERFISNLLDMTRLESGGLQPRFELYPLGDIVASVLERFRQRTTHRKIQVNIRPDLPLLSVDGSLFEQVLINLLDNALEYTPESSPITISADADDQQITIRFSDRGPGLPRDDPNRVFQKFYRSSTGDNHRGIGLGLTICRSIVELHHGTITARNLETGGAEFIITLPNPSHHSTLQISLKASEIAS
ncbi:MAG TPA: sensor histidine kinase KdpD [Phycisphaerae bacterium]|nr:sensor histidine kinase KdpD [Phycisphaerae bacterium]